MNSILKAFQLALDLADAYRGATAPNPPVGAAALDANGKILSVQAHQKAGQPHAEAKVLEDCRDRGGLDQIHTLVVTLEPCNHQGRTPPCTEAILAQKQIQEIIIATPDPNPKVAGGGAERLIQAGRRVRWLHQIEGSAELVARAEELIQPFQQWSTTGLPWVTVKTAFQKTLEQAHELPWQSMIPPRGQRTFTSPASLQRAHELRRRSDAILTGSGTVLLDQPELTVRHVQDHFEKRRWVVVMDRRKRIANEASDWLAASSTRNFEVHLESEREIPEVLKYLGNQGVLEVLVEAGPTLSRQVLESGFWNEHVVITPTGIHDQIEVRRNKCLPESSKK